MRTEQGEARDFLFFLLNYSLGERELWVRDEHGRQARVKTDQFYFTEYHTDSHQKKRIVLDLESFEGVKNES